MDCGTECIGYIPLLGLLLFIVLLIHLILPILILQLLHLLLVLLVEGAPNILVHAVLEDANRHIDIVQGNAVPQADLAAGSGEADDGLEVRAVTGRALGTVRG